MAQAKTIERPGGASALKRRSYVLTDPPAKSRSRKLSIPVTAAALRALASKEKMVREITEAIGQLVRRIENSGKAAGITVTIEPDGSSRVDQFVSEAAAANDANVDAFARARERGRIRAAQVLDSPEMLTADAFAERLGVSRVTVNSRRSKNELLGLDGAKRGYRFPEWQVDEDGKAFKVLPRLFELLGPSPWTIYRFLVQRHSVLGGKAAKDALRLGQSDAVVQAAESLARGDFA